MDFTKVFEQYKESFLKTLQELVKIPSVLTEFDPNNKYPFGKDIHDALDYMITKAKQDGFDAANIDEYAGEITYGDTGKLIGILCHLDVVPVGANWKFDDPFSGIIEDGKMYGRGTSDDKGPTICAYYALKMIKDAGIKLKNTVRIILGTDEETGWRGVEYYLKKRPTPDYGFAPDADFPLIYGEKGRETFDLSSSFDEDDILVSITGGERYNVVLEEVTAIIKKDLSKEFLDYCNQVDLEGNVSKLDDGNYKLILKGIPAHGAMPNLGKNAGTYMCNFLKDYTNNKMVKWCGTYLHEGYFLDKVGSDYKDYEMGPITCNIGVMNISYNTRVTLDIRYPVRYPKEKHDNLVNNIKDSGLMITDHTNKDPHYIEPTDPLVTKLYDAYLKHTNDYEHKPFTIGGGTYAGIMPKGVAFGMLFPNEEELAHQCNECVSLESLFKTTLIYVDAILSLGEVDA